jgi:hypothetical protein
VKIAPYSDGVHNWFLASDEGSPRDADFIVGAGGASSTLASLVPRIPFATAVDIGCGGGVQSLHLSTHVAKIVATDLNPRAPKPRDAPASNLICGLAVFTNPSETNRLT